MSDSFSAKRDSILKIFTISIMGFTAVKETRHSLFFFFWLFLSDNLDILLACQNLLSKFSYLRSIIFFIDHIESGDELSQSLILLFNTLCNIIEHFLYVCFANNFESSENKFELEVRGLLLKLIDDLPDDS